jgi:heterodisulfide reductase subunit B
MKTYSYYPGCSLEKMAASYHNSTLACAQALGVELKELEDWNCCGATAYFHIDEILACTLSARNLAIAERTGLNLVVPCSGCYKNMYFAREHLMNDPDLAEHVNYALEADNLEFRGQVEVLHALDLFVKEVGVEEIKKKVKRPLKGLRVAPYYGCQILRPRKEPATIGDVEGPRFFEDLLAAIGATPVNFPRKLSCCGASLIITNRKAALAMIYDLLQSAVDQKTDILVTACPLCQVNLECYQQQVNQEYGTRLSLPILFFTQLLGLALGLPEKELGIGSEFVSARHALDKALEQELVPVSS